MTEESYLITPRTDADPTSVFNEKCAESRLEELTKLIIAIYIEEDLKTWAKEHRLKGENVPPYPQDQIKEKFYEKARQEAIKILEQEKRNVVENRAKYIENTLNIIIKQLRLLVYTEHGKGKVYLKKVPVEGNVGQSNPHERDIMYFETYPEGIERYQQIGQQKSRIEEFNDYFEFMNEDLAALYQQASALANVEFVGEKEKDAKT